MSLDVPIWVYANVGFVALYLVAHAFIYHRYRTRKADRTASSRSGGTPAGGRSLKADGGSTIDHGSGFGNAGASDEERIRCPSCRTANEPSFRFCRSCATDMTI